MPLLRGLDEIADFRGGVVSIGNFDGVHLGHREIVRTLVDRARERGCPAVVLTFDPHPIRLLRPEAEPPSLNTLERKAELLTDVGVDAVVAYPTDRALLSLTPEWFFEQIVREKLDAAGLVEGPNFYFGKDRAGDVDTLRELADAAGITVDVVEPLQAGDAFVSSSRIRAAIADGRLQEAVGLLGHPYRLTGTVGRGAGRGRGLGTPTANLTEVATLLPAHGVYAGTAVVDGTRHAAAVNVGPNPTFGDEATKIEAHLVGFAGDLYGRVLDLDLHTRLRDVRSFESADELRSQIAEDVRRAVEAVEKA